MCTFLGLALMFLWCSFCRSIHFQAFPLKVEASDCCQCEIDFSYYMRKNSILAFLSLSDANERGEEMFSGSIVPGRCLGYTSFFFLLPPQLLVSLWVCITQRYRNSDWMRGSEMEQSHCSGPGSLVMVTSHSLVSPPRSNPSRSRLSICFFLFQTEKET